MTASRRRLDPDALAALEEERDFLLRSLEDLEAELEVGDIDEQDYAELKDDYTRRAAEVIRSIEAQRAAFQSTPRVGGRQIVAWVVGLAILGGLSGVLIARSSGARSANDSFTGDVRSSVVSLLNEARSLFSTPDRWAEAIEIYDEALQQQPSNVEALTYRGWLRYRSGEPADTVLADFEEVGRLDATYPDATVFHAIVLADEGDHAAAADVLSRLDLASAPAEVRIVLDAEGIVGEVYGEATYAPLLEAGEPTLADLGVDTERALAAAGYLLSSDKDARAVAAIKLYRAVRIDDPGNAAALSREALILFQSSGGAPELEAQAIDLANQAVAANPDDPEALITRASILADIDAATACADVAALTAMELPAALADRVADIDERFC